MGKYKYVVTLSSYHGNLLLSRHRERTTWESQGGHIEPGESPLEAAKRELYEESGALEYTIEPLCDYWVDDEVCGNGAGGMVFIAEIQKLGDMPDSEIAEVREFEQLPENLTYPDITPYLFKKAIEKLPEKIQKFVDSQNSEEDTIGMSAASVRCYENAVLKVSLADEQAEREAAMLNYLQGKLPVPGLLAIHKRFGMQYLLMERVTGVMSCEKEYLDKPEQLIRILADGLKQLWQVEIEKGSDGQYIYDSRLKERLRHAEYLVREGLCDLENVEEGTYGENGFSGPEELLAWLKENQPEEDLVFSHGDYCLPNIFIKDGKLSGFIDLGKTGVADRYQDLALCYRSLCHNYDGTYGGKVYEGVKPEMLFELLGIEPDWKKMKYYILLDELF